MADVSTAVVFFLLKRIPAARYPGLRTGVPRVKTAMPRLSPRHQRRGRLLDLLDRCGPDQVTLVSAPTGYGKTQLLAEWAAAQPEAVAWVSLDDDDDHRFRSAILSAISSCLGPDNPVDGLVVPGGPSGDPEFLAAVAGIIDAVVGPVHLVLDDVHELTASAPLHGLAALVRDRSAGLRLIGPGRADPPLPVARMRLNGEWGEIRADQLRFSVACGWRRCRCATATIRSFLDDLAGGRAVSDYLVGEILSRLAPGTLEFLRAVSICNRLSAQLAAAVSGRADAGEVLDALERETALVLSSGEGRFWYRIQPLLRAYLRADLRRRQPDTVVALHGRAAGWFAVHGRPVHALTHARLGGSPGTHPAPARPQNAPPIAPAPDRSCSCRVFGSFASFGHVIVAASQTVTSFLRASSSSVATASSAPGSVSNRHTLNVLTSRSSSRRRGGATRSSLTEASRPRLPPLWARWLQC